MNIQEPTPGSVEAAKQGCVCPIIDNCYGKGVGGNGEQYGWWVTAECPLHGVNGNEMNFELDHMQKEELINNLKEFQEFLAKESDEAMAQIYPHNCYKEYYEGAYRAYEIAVYAMSEMFGFELPNHWDGGKVAK